MAAKRAMMLLGRCIEATREEGVQVVVTMRELDRNLRMYFPERYTFFAYDATEHCKPGDIVLIKKLDEPLTRKITHEIMNIIHPIGDITDPISGKKVMAGQYREHMEERDLMFSSPDGGGFTKYITKLRKSQESHTPDKTTNTVH